MNYAAETTGSRVSHVTSPPIPEPRLDQLESRLTAACHEASLIGRRVRSLADRLIGPQPETGVSSVGEKADRPPSLRRLEIATEDLHRLIAVASDHLSRLEAL